MNTAQIVQHPNTELMLMSELIRLKQQLRDVEYRLQHFHKYSGKKQLSVFASGQNRLVNIADIIMISAYSNYSTIFLKNGDTVFTSKTLKHWATECNSNELIRLHKSFLVNKSMIMSIDAKAGQVALPNGLKAKYSRMSKSALCRLLHV